MKEGERYVVLYYNQDVNKSNMLFLYPIKEDSDFEKYLEEFKDNPPKYIDESEMRRIFEQRTKRQ